MPIRTRRGGGRIASGKLLHLNQPILGIIAILRVIARREQRLSREVLIVVISIAVGRIGRRLIAGIRHTAIRGPLADRIVGKGLWIERQWKLLSVTGEYLVMGS